MGDLTIDLGDRLEERACPCCGRPFRNGRGSVLRGGVTCAAYWVNLYQRHPDRRAHVLISLGDEESPPIAAFLVEAWPHGDGIASGLREPSASPWLAPAEVVGELLTREAALEHPALPTVWEVLDFLVEADPALHRHLLAEPEPHRPRRRRRFSPRRR